MKFLLHGVVLVLLALCPATAQAQGVDITGYVSWLTLEEQSIEDPDLDIELEWESDLGFGAGANWFWGDHLSTELSVLALQAEAQLNFAFPDGGDDEEITLALGEVDLTPIMLAAQWHFNTDGFVDPYIGIGAAYVLIGDLETILDDEVFTTEIDDEFGVFGNIGVGFSFTPNFGLLLDARYMPLEPSTTELDEFGEPSGQEEEIELNPLIVSAGLRWRFGGR